MPVAVRKKGTPLPDGIQVCGVPDLDDNAWEIMRWLLNNNHVEKGYGTFGDECVKYRAKTEVGQILLRLIASRFNSAEEIKWTLN